MLQDSTWNLCMIARNTCESYLHTLIAMALRVTLQNAIINKEKILWDTEDDIGGKWEEIALIFL